GPALTARAALSCSRPPPPAPPPLSLHDALPICRLRRPAGGGHSRARGCRRAAHVARRRDGRREGGRRGRQDDRRAQGRSLPPARSEEHTSELQSRENLVCRLLLEKKKHTRADRP